jgi:DNA-binding transcriptional LysR family regulator
MLRIGCVPYLPLQQLQGFLGALYTEHARLRIGLSYAPSSTQLERIADGRLDLGLVDELPVDHRYERHALFRGEPLSVFVPIGHELGARTQLDPDDLRGETLVVTARAVDAFAHDRQLGLLERAGLRFGALLESGSADARDHLAAVAQGRAVALAPPGTAAAAGPVGANVERVSLADPVHGPGIAVVWSSSVPRPPGRILAAVREIAHQLVG